MNIAIIPAKGTSSRIPGKNIAQFHGKPLLAYSIETARESGLFSTIVVSTESEEVAQVAKEYGAQVLERDPRYCADDIGTQQVTRSVLAQHIVYYYACCIYATAPTMRACDLADGYAKILRAPDRYAYIDGWFYWGRTETFLMRPELTDDDIQLGKPMSRWVDINTPEEFSYAEERYAQMKKKRA